MTALIVHCVDHISLRVLRVRLVTFPYTRVYRKFTVLPVRLVRICRNSQALFIQEVPFVGVLPGGSKQQVALPRSLQKKF